MRGISIGAVLVHRGEPPDSNPYRGETLLGSARLEALTRWANRGMTGDCTFWFGPSHGGARRLNDPDEVNWSASFIVAPLPHCPNCGAAMRCRDCEA